MIPSLLGPETITGRLSSAVIYFTLDSEANEDPPEFTLTCQSRGGPVTEVEWMRNGVRVEEDSNHTTSQIIVDTSNNTVYNNTLRVRGRESGIYKCTVSNNRYVQENVMLKFSTTISVKGVVCSYQNMFISFSIICRGNGISEPECYLQVTYQHFTGVDICQHTHLPIFLCGIPSVWRRGLQCGLHH